MRADPAMLFLRFAHVILSEAKDPRAADGDPSLRSG